MGNNHPNANIVVTKSHNLYAAREIDAMRITPSCSKNEVIAYRMTG